MAQRFSFSRLAIALAIAAGITLLSAVLPWIDGEDVMAVAQALALVAVVIALIGAVVTAILRKWLIIPLWLVAALAWFTPLIPPHRDAPPVGSGMIVMSANLFSSSVAADDVVNAIREQHVDVAILLEVEPSYARDVAAQLSKEGFSLAAPAREGGVQGSAIITRLEHRAPTVEPMLPSSGMEMPVAQVKAGTTWVTVRAIHPEPPVISSGWRTQLRELRAWVNQQSPTVPVVLAGDFNASSVHPAFRELMDGFSQATPMSGLTWTPTWPVGTVAPAFATIDHIAIRGGAAGPVTTVDMPGSDHRAVIAAVWPRDVG